MSILTRVAREGSLRVQVAGLDLDERLKRARSDSSFEASEPFVDFVSGLDRIEVFIEPADRSSW